MVIETTEDPLFGPVVSFGLSGVAYDVMEDRAYAVPPLSGHDIEMLLDGPRAAGLLRARPCRARRSTAVRCTSSSPGSPGWLTTSRSWRHLVLRPVVVSEDGAAVLGARVTLRRPVGRTDLPARRLLG